MPKLSKMRVDEAAPRGEVTPERLLLLCCIGAAMWVGIYAAVMWVVG